MARTGLFLALALLLVAAPIAGAQRISSTDKKRYLAQLAPSLSLEARQKTMKDVAFFNNESAMKILLEGMAKSLRALGRLEKDRTDNEKKIRAIIGPQLVRGGDPLSVNYAGVEMFQKLQKVLGGKITREEHVLREYRITLATFTGPKPLKMLRTHTPKSVPRMRLELMSIYGLLDQELFSERLIELLADKELDVRIAAAEALSHHDKKRVPPTCYGGLLHADEWQARAVAIDALGRHPSPESIQLLVTRCPLESGRLLADICYRLEDLTGQKFGKTPAAWLNWWEKAKANFQPAEIVLGRTVHAKGDGRIDYWGIRLESLNVVFVIDISGTMHADVDDHENLFPEPGRSRLDLARKKLKATISALPSDARFNVIAYNDVVLRWEDKLLRAMPATKARCFEWMDKLVATSSTNIFDALEMAFQISAPGTKDKYYDQTPDTILFISDGGPTAGRTTDEEEILEQVREWNRTKKVTLHTIGIGRQLNRSFIKALADQNGGEHRFVD